MEIRVEVRHNADGSATVRNLGPAVVMACGCTGVRLALPPTPAELRLSRPFVKEMLAAAP